MRGRSGRIAGLVTAGLCAACRIHSLSARNVRAARCVLWRCTRRFVAKKSQESQDQIAKGAAVMNDAVNAMSSVTAYAPAPAPRAGHARARWDAHSRAQLAVARHGRQQRPTPDEALPLGRSAQSGSVGTHSSLRGWGAFRRYSLQTTICGLYNEHIAISLRAKILDMSGQTSRRSHAPLARRLARTARTHGSHGFVLVAQALPGVRRSVHHFPDEHKQGRALHLRRVPVRAPAHDPAGVPPATVASAQTVSMRRPDETAIADAARARTGGADIRAEGSLEGRTGETGEKAQGG